MSEGLEPAAPVVLGRHAAYYREKAAECQQSLDDAADPDAGFVTARTRELLLWIQLADEIDRYLGAGPDDDPGLF